ncbi:MAG: efflux RND transporter periplasmic adaptor subunit [Bradymonadaceae bacterium]|nr:efflux RND transporter periplasmic adaptor subunit [Lujinxingiaceae bacterium]
MIMLKKIVLQAVLPLIIIAAALATAVTLVQSRPEPQRAAPGSEGILVQTATAARSMHRMDVAVRGAVTASRQVSLQSQLAGRVVWMHPELQIGGFVKEGEVLLRIEARDYEIAAEESKTVVDQARAQLAIEEGQQVIAQREWALFANDSRSGADDPGLALRKPQLKMAESSVKAAEARQKRTQLDLSRTVVRAPFNGFVQAIAVELGQLVNNQSQMATLVGTDTVWVSASVPIERLAAIEIPGSQAIIRQDTGSHTVERPGKVVRLLGDLDPVGRMARVLIEVEDPFDLKKEASAKAKLPLLVRAFVEVAIEGSESRELIEIPRRNVHNGDTVYVVESDGTLGLRPVAIVWRTSDSVLIEEGLSAGERYVTSSIAAPMQGMKLRTVEAGHE